ncbi:putative target of rapamycin (TOR) kinase 1 [Trypanosoma cruzi]|uniref:Putative target of rapamycin (TOR) kinase 1 n=1 Tax=Trypanosoma cruzi TaxID=5693 RepID=A0A2V2VZD0_TRYCR|nr:putative target of rapamycin (TOR) kinase 1 [Trypanosoma cruzi]
MPALNSLTISEMEVVASRFLYAAAILCTRLCDHYFFIKAVRRQLSAVNRGLCWRHPRRTFRRQRLVWARDYDSSSRTIASESSIPRKRHRPPSSRTHRSMDGEPFKFQTPATLKLPEGNGRGSLFLSCRPRHEQYAWPYRPFPPFCHPLWTFGWTALRCEERRIKAAQNHTP